MLHHRNNLQASNLIGQNRQATSHPYNNGEVSEEYEFKGRDSHRKNSKLWKKKDVLRSSNMRNYPPNQYSSPHASHQRSLEPIGIAIPKPEARRRVAVTVGAGEVTVDCPVPLQEAAGERIAATTTPVELQGEAH